jgi:hypothetical protein
MKYLIYCIFEKPRDRNISVFSPTDGHPVLVTEQQGLCAVYSEISSIVETREISEMINYHRVIESFFNQVTVVPFRFGTVLDERGDVDRLVSNRAEHYRKILQELEGCAEMGIRAIMDECEIPPGEGRGSSGTSSSDDANPGKLYLSSRKNHYCAESLLAENNQRATERFRDAFTGMFRRFRSEFSRLEVQGESSSAILLSLYFLVPKDALSRFRQTFAELVSEETARLMLSGPWPPYNFVLPGDPPAK